MKKPHLAVAGVFLAMGLTALTATAAEGANYKIATSAGAAPVAVPSAFTVVNKPGTSVINQQSYGTVTCSGNPALYGRGTLTGNSGTSAYSTLGSLSSAAFGNPLVGPFTSTPASTRCPGSLQQIPTCVVQVDNLPVNVRTRSNAAIAASGGQPAIPADSGIQVAIGPITIKTICDGNGGGTISCYYSANVPNGPAGTVTGYAPFGSNDVVFNDRPGLETRLYRVSPSPSTCPTNDIFRATLNLVPGNYTTPNTPTSPVPPKLAAYPTN